MAWTLYLLGIGFVIAVYNPLSGTPDKPIFRYIAAIGWPILYAVVIIKAAINRKPD